MSGKTNLRQLLDIRRMKITQILLAHTKHTDYSTTTIYLSPDPVDMRGPGEVRD